MEDIDRALAIASAHQGAPSVILARTLKGRGVTARFIRPSGVGGQVCLAKYERTWPGSRKPC
jgi:hypothetical protein